MTRNHEGSAQRGLFIVLEGIDGSGTTTQAELLHAALSQEGRAVHLTREPSTGPVGRFLRQALCHELTDAAGQKTQLNWASMAQLFAADRLDHVEREIAPALARGEVVICDRYDLSSLLYQSLTSPEGEAALPWLRELNQKALRPCLTLVLDLAPEVAAARRAQRGGPEELYEKAELQRRLAEAYAKAPSYIPKDHILVISADDTVESLQARIRAIIQEFEKA